MKGKAVEIRWHETLPIFSLDIQKTKQSDFTRTVHPYMRKDEPAKPYEESTWRVATAGADKQVRMWLLRARSPVEKNEDTQKTPEEDSSIEYLATLRHHHTVVNVVRFSPLGDVLASAADDGNVALWIPSTKEASYTFGVTDDEDSEFDREFWRVRQTLITRQGKEIYDLAWFPDQQRIAVASTDYTVTIFNVLTGEILANIQDHSNYVQGISIDPLGAFLASQSSDRSALVYSLETSSNSEYALMNRIQSLPLDKKNDDDVVVVDQAAGPSAAEKVPLFAEAGTTPFFRRLSWSPDGSLLVTPAALMDPSLVKEQDDSPSGTLVFTRGTVGKAHPFVPPVFFLPGQKTTALCVRFNPVLYKHSEGSKKNASPLNLPYRMIYAVVSSESVVLYDTAHLDPIAIVGHLHFAPFTDAAWTPDGQALALSSQDGYCSVISFGVNELGIPYEGTRPACPSAIPLWAADPTTQAAAAAPVNVLQVKKKKKE